MKSFILNEEAFDRLQRKLNVTESQFNANMRYFLHQLLADPVNAELPTCIKAQGISRPKFINMLIDWGIVQRNERLNDTDKEGNHKTPTMSVKYTVNKIPDELEYKVAKTDFDRKIEKLRRSIFEKNISEEKCDSVSWLANRAAEALNTNLTLKEESSYNPQADNPREESDNFTEEENEIIRIVNQEIEKTHRPKDKKKEHYNTYAIRWAEFYYDDIVKTFAMNIVGGFNGSGDWFDYFNVLSDFCKKLEEQGIHVFLINAQNDCPDDIYDMQFGLKKKSDELNEEGGDGGATSAAASGAFIQPLFGKIVKREIKEMVETLSPNSELNARYRNLGGGFEVHLEDGSVERSVVTVQNKKTKTLYHICSDGVNFNVFRDMNDGQPATHISYVFDELFNALQQSGYINIQEQKTRRVFKVTEEQMRLFKEATTTTTVGGTKTDYQYTVPFPTDSKDETMKRHNGEGGSVSINHVNESNKESLHTANVGDYINDNPIGIHPEDPTMKRGEGKHGSHCIEKIHENKKKEDFFEKHGIDKNKGDGSIGFSEKEQKWYGWSHRAIQGFGIGDKFKECYPGETKIGRKIKTLEDAKEAAKKFADSVS